MPENTKDNFQKCIVIDKKEFKHFKNNLNNFNNIIQNTQLNYIKTKNKLLIQHRMIIKRLEEERDFFKEILKSINTNNNIENGINKPMNNLYKDFFESFENNKELLRYLEKETDDYFFLNKIYQLSHFLGILYQEEWCNKVGKKNCDKNPVEDYSDLRNYILLYYFLDFYESFAKYMTPVIKKLGMELSGHYWLGRYNAREVYDIWLNRKRLNINEKYTVDTLRCFLGAKDKESKEDYNALRNVIAHSTIYLDRNGKIRIKERDANQYDTDYINKINGKDFSQLEGSIKRFLYTAIIFTTEFDIRILKLFPYITNKDEYKRWKKYLKTYNEAWQRIGENNTDEN